MATGDPQALAHLKAAFLTAFGCFVSCGGAAKHVEAPNEGWEADDESTPLDKSALSHDARVRFDGERVKVVDGDAGPTSYAFEDGHGEVSQDDFVERYHELTGRTDLDRAKSGNAETASIVGGSTMMVVGAVGDAVLLALSLQHAHSCGSPMVQGCDNNGPAIDPGIAIAGSLGFTALGAAGALLFHSGIDSNRARELSRDDAEYYARQYNRALLRKALRSSERQDVPRLVAEVVRLRRLLKHP